MTAQEHSNIPRVPDAPPLEEQFLPVLYVDGKEYGRREEVDVCSSLDAAMGLAEVFVRNVTSGGAIKREQIRVVILRRQVGPWTEDHAMYGSRS